MTSLRDADQKTLADLAKQREVKTLILDIERMKGTASVEFWSLSDFKNRRIHADDVTDWPRTICVAHKWLGAKKSSFTSEWDDGQQGMHQKIWEAIDQADIVIGHNSVGFDMKHLNTGFRDNGLYPPSPYKNVDTLKVARAAFGDESKTLDALTKRVGVSSKTDRYDVEVARAACAGNKTAQTRIKRYNIGDIVATEALYMELLPWVKGHLHVAPTLGLDNLVCPRCGSDDIAREGTYSPAVNVYAAYRCNTCGGNFRDRFESRGPNARTI